MQKVKQGILSLLPISRHMFSPFQESRACVMFSWKDKYHHFEYPPLLPLSPVIYCWAWHHIVYSIPSISWGNLFMLWSSQLLAHPHTPHWQGSMKNGKVLGSVQELLCNNWKHWCVTSTFFIRPPTTLCKYKWPEKVEQRWWSMLACFWQHYDVSIHGEIQKLTGRVP